jgi:hypothetical protein
MYKKEECSLCYDFGYQQVYKEGRVARVICDCPVGRRIKERIDALKKKK